MDIIIGIFYYLIVRNACDLRINSSDERVKGIRSCNDDPIDHGIVRYPGPFKSSANVKTKEALLLKSVVV